MPRAYHISLADDDEDDGSTFSGERSFVYWKHDNGNVQCVGSTAVFEANVSLGLHVSVL